MPDATKAHLVGLWMLAGRYHNELPANLDFLSQKLNATEVVDWEALLGGGWITPYGILASELLASCKQSASTEVQKYRGTEVQKKHSSPQAELDEGPTTDEFNGPGTALVPLQGLSLTVRETAVVGKAARRAEIQQGLDLAADVIFRYWRDSLGKNPKTTLFGDRPGKKRDPRKAKVVAALRENGGDVSELLYAIDGALKDDWLMGRAPNSTRTYNDLETILRDRSQIERLRDTVRNHETLHPYLEQP
jgi:hypothetical protein